MTKVEWAGRSDRRCVATVPPSCRMRFLASVVHSAISRARRHFRTRSVGRLSGGPDCGADELEDCSAGRVHSASCGEEHGVGLWAVAISPLLEGCVEEGFDCVGKVAFRGGVGECEVEDERDGCPHGADCYLDDGFVPLAVWSSACEGWNGGFLVGAPVARMLLARAARLASWSGFLPWPARRTVTRWPSSSRSLPQMRPQWRAWS